MGFNFSRLSAPAARTSAPDDYTPGIDSRPVRATYPPRFPSYNADAAQYMAQHGYVVIADVASREEIERAKQLFWDHAEYSVPRLKRDDPSTFVDENWITDPNTGIVHTFGIGQSAFVWSIRTLPKVRQAFEDLWQEKKMIVSFDRANAFRPWHREGCEDWKTNGGWWHVDQSPVVRPGLECVQGLVDLYDCDATTGGFCAIPGSMHKFLELNTQPHTRDFVRIPLNHSILETQGELICHKAGDMVLWDSRTAHCNHPAIERPVTSTNDLLRLAVYVCMLPYSSATPETIRNRKDAFTFMYTTTHWPNMAPTRIPEAEEFGLAPENPVPMTREIADLVGYYDI